MSMKRMHLQDQLARGRARDEFEYQGACFLFRLRYADYCFAGYMWNIFAFEVAQKLVYCKFVGAALGPARVTLFKQDSLSKGTILGGRGDASPIAVREPGERTEETLAAPHPLIVNRPCFLFVAAKCPILVSE